MFPSLFLCLFFFTQHVQAGAIRLLEPIPLPKDITQPKDLSAIAIWRNAWWLASDERSDDGRNLIQRFHRHGHGPKDISLFQGGEMDIEAMAASGDSLYVIGSHAWRRKRLHPDKRYRHNRHLLWANAIRPAPSRNRLYHLRSTPQGIKLHGPYGLRSMMENHPILAPFAHLPGKENGVNIEGLAVRDRWLYVGFRAPVLRGGMTPVLRLERKHPEAGGALLFVSLYGLGIRAMTETRDGLLLIAGPANEGNAPFILAYWDGKDMVPGRDAPGGRVCTLLTLPDSLPGRPEGIALRKEDGEVYDLLLVLDGAPSTKALWHLVLAHRNMTECASGP